MLRTRSPLGRPEQAPWTSFDLHVLSTPPAFILSQDQTLQQKRVRLGHPRVGGRAGNECQRAHHPSRERLMWTMRPCCVVLSNRYPCCRRQGVPTAELTDSHRDPRVVRLPALAFCLLFRFQGAEALALTVSGSVAAVAGGSPWSGVGAEWPFRRVKTLREAELEDSSSGGACNTPQEIISTRWCDFFPLRSSR